MRVLDLNILMTHKGPRRQIRLIELRSAPEVLNRALGLAAQGVVVADHAAYFWPVFVNGEEVVRDFGELDAVLGDVEDVGEDVDIVETHWVEAEDDVEDGFCALEVCVGRIVKLDKYKEKAGPMIAYHEGDTALLPASS